MVWLRRLQVLIAVLTIIAGAMLYLLFRSRELVGFHLLDALGLTGIVDYLRNSVATVSPPEFVVFCLPDGLWTVAYILLVDYLCRTAPLCERIVAASVIPAIGAVSELMQGAGVLIGTFDAFDLLCYIVPYLSYGALLFMISKTNKSK